mmetsp:Transcript_65050/g.136272  ORF Transcript_65050/g.136272 Transcript_65050/m.136272 type:complete len:623 (+) Transcript_65050:210-2078(+)
MAPPPPPPLCDADRTPSAHSRTVTEGVWCFEREFEGQDCRPKVKLIIFDWDETLTLSTFLPADHGLRTRIGWNEWADYITLHNFETPFVQSAKSRVQKLRELFASLAFDPETGDERILGILTRNNQGSIACLNLLMMAGLHTHFSALWCMRHTLPNSVFRKADGSWASFTAPISEVYDHKADVITSMCKNPETWFPQFKDNGNPLQGLRMEEVVLVDDVRTNFQSNSNEKPKILRYCKVARYDCVYREHGFKRDMGGLGAKTDRDYVIILDFVRKPWEYKAVLKAQCIERPFPKSEMRPPVDLVVFDFDETLTVHTWMPPDRQCKTEIGFRLPVDQLAHFTEYNFASPYAEYNRVELLDAMLQDLVGPYEDRNGDTRTRSLAILTRNEDGAVAVLNLLAMAGLDRHFSAIWVLGTDPEAGAANGVYRQGSEWRTFELPARRDDMEPTKLNVLRCVVEDPKVWFPQLSVNPDPSLATLAGLSSLASIVLVDDERSSFQGAGGEGDCIFRHCEVTRYDDDNFRGQGLVTHMGGLGAKCAEDFVVLQDFIKRPWQYRENAIGQDEDDHCFDSFMHVPNAKSEVHLVRQHPLEEVEEDNLSPMSRRKARRTRSCPGFAVEEVVDGH